MRYRNLTMLSIWLLGMATSAFASSERMEPAPPIVMTVAARQETIKTGSKLIIDVAIKNTSNQTIDISGNFFLNWSSPYGFRVWRDGVEEHETPTAAEWRSNIFRPSSSQMDTILPGKQDNAAYELGYYFDVSQLGTYRVQFFGGEGTILPANNAPEEYEDKRRFESNIITIVVTP